MRYGGIETYRCGEALRQERTLDKTSLVPVVYYC